MINRKEEIVSFLGRAIFVALFFLFAVAFSERTGEQRSDASPCGIVSEVHDQNANAILVNANETPGFQKNWVSSFDQKGFKLYQASFKIVADNKEAIQKINVIRKAELSIKPFIYKRFYHHLPSTEADDFPILS